ncbi:hybrid sensor histidine kinase/response regulator [Xaviernesmea oryzae]|uniref:histidine kinase n=1 Tax=Xaviernesmea oryzae TaxID=464029 RepID=A0A1Q9AXL7_9HYPH|nr:PAS domain-containing protein [Xaviernesmea oryzae]OLP60176.1 hybrid sensor histidine kinase/response regulator [Xaviernesmea oryzae]SEK30182.1 PAS domain S-box-containing protein [Xaviernesmea oryzae]
MTLEMGASASWPIGGGQTGALIRAFDWASTPLGPIASWPQNLRIKVNSLVNSPIPQVLMWGPAHIMLYNDGYIDIAGKNHPRALGGRVEEIWPEIWHWNSRILEAGARGEVQSFSDQKMTLNRSGEPEDVVFDLFYTPIYNDVGRVDGVLCTVLDNTEKVHATQALAESQAEIRRITDALPLLVGYVGRDGIYRFANRGYIDWFGRKPEEVVGRHLREVIGDAFYARRLALIERGFAGEAIVTDTLIERPDGEERAAEIRYVPDIRADGTVEGLYIVILDITERKKVESDLQRSNARFAAAVEAVHGILWTNSANGRMLGEQPGWGALTGQSFAQYQNYGWSDAVHPDDREPSIATWRAAVAAKETYVWEHRVRRHDGAWRIFAIRAVPILDDGGEIAEWVGIHTDITEQREAESALRRHAIDLERQIRHRERAEEQLRLLNETLEGRVEEEIAVRRAAERALQQSQKMETIGKLTGGVAHDFNNLLQVVSGNLQLLSKDVTGNERAERRVTNALAGVARGAKLAAQLLAFGRRQPLEPKVTNIGRFLTGMDDLLRRSLGEAIEIETVVAGGLWNSFVDPLQVENAVLNLAINARDAMNGQGKLTIEVGNAFLDDDYARIQGDVTPGQYVCVSVSDTGSGMTPQVLEQVFEPFFSTKPEGKGSGLGLSMVYGFVKQSGGHVKIYSEVGQGTSVKIYLPRATEGEDREVEVQSGPVVGGNETVLVVEDDDEVRATVVEMLTDLGYGVLKATNAQNALSVIESGISIQLLFTDVVMPGPLKSTELARKAKERLPGLSVLFTSGYTENAIVHGGRLDPDVELISKPYAREMLARKIRHVLANSAQRHQAEAPRPAPARPLAAPALSRTLTVMVVEDDALIRANSREMIEDAGHNVIEAGSAEEAQRKLQTSDPDVLVTDLGLPDASGGMLARAARQLRPSLGLVFATGNDRLPEDAEPGAILLMKPFDSERLVAAIAASLMVNEAETSVAEGGD